MMMTKVAIFFASLFLLMEANAQTNFESKVLDSTHMWKGTTGVAGTTIFYDGPVSFINRNDTSGFGDYWSGWGYSSKQDTVSIDYTTNDMACIVGKGYNNSNVYGVAYQSWNPEYNRIRVQPTSYVSGFYITNTTIAYRSMQNGDFVAKKFGGSTGNDPDFFRIDITGWWGGVAKTDTVRFYLADFRDSNNANDYIVNDWRWVNTSALGLLDSLTYNLVSSDNDTTFGMNTPAYFCIDNLTSGPVTVNDISFSNEILVYPNPIKDYCIVENKSNESVSATMMSLNGQLVFDYVISANESYKLNAAHLAKGVYTIRIQKGMQTYYHKISK